MTPDDPTPPDLDALAADLRSLRPGRLDPTRRDSILFEAGRASARRPAFSARVWPALAASLALVALGEAAWIAHRPPPLVVERIVVVREPAASPVPGPTLAPASTPPEPVRPVVAADPPFATPSRFDRAIASSAGPIGPDLPGPSGLALRRAMVRLALSPSGGSL